MPTGLCFTQGDGQLVHCQCHLPVMCILLMAISSLFIAYCSDRWYVATGSGPLFIVNVNHAVCTLSIARADVYTASGNGQFVHCQWQWPVCTLPVAMASLVSILPEAMPVDRECIKKEKKRMTVCTLSMAMASLICTLAIAMSGLYIATKLGLWYHWVQTRNSQIVTAVCM